MEERIVEFISALRGVGVRVSLAESEDAFRAIESLGIKDRKLFRLCLQTTLVKDAGDLPLFQELFPIFFSSSETPPMTNPSDDITPEEARMLDQVLRQFSAHRQEMVDRLLKGEMLTKEELERLAKMVGLTQIDNLRYRKWMEQRMKKALRFKEVEHALRDLAETLASLGMDNARAEQLVQLMQANQQAIEKQVKQYAGQRITQNMNKQTRDINIDALINRHFSALSERDMERLRKEVQRLAAILRTRVALRQKRAKSGQLDAKATIRTNLKHGNVPILIKHRQRSLKPRLVVLCDVSTSMRFCSELMLSLLYHLQDLISRTQAFAFIDHLEYISPDLMGREANEAVDIVQKRLPSGYYSTDLGNSLEDFQEDYLHTIDGRTTFILVGDGRNNYNDPRLDIFKTISQRSRRTIWINPEAPALWASGDSDMLDYASNCDVILQASNLSQLTAAVDKLLIS